MNKREVTTPPPDQLSNRNLGDFSCNWACSSIRLSVQACPLSIARSGDPIRNRIGEHERTETREDYFLPAIIRPVLRAAAQRPASIDKCQRPMPLLAFSLSTAWQKKAMRSRNS